MKRKKVALFVANLYNEMVRETVEGMYPIAREENVKLIFFTSFADKNINEKYARYENHDVGDYAVFLLPDLKDYDGLLSFDTYMPLSFLGPINQLKEKAPCPVVTLGTVKEGTYSVVNDQARSMKELIGHMIVDHGARELVHIAGTKGRSFVQERIAIFQEAMAYYGLPGDEEHIIYGDLSEECGEAVAEELLRRYALKDRKLPDAVICVNDYTAIGLMRALESRGYRIPEDVLVTGYDNVLRAKFNEPSVTTSAQPFAQVGRTGIDILVRLWRGDTPPAVTAVPGILKKRRSCGCEPYGIYKKDEIREKYISAVSRLENFVFSGTNLILGAAVDENIEAVFQEIENDCLLDTGFSDAVLCLMEGWDQKRIIQDRDALQNARFQVVCGMYRGRPVQRGWLPRGELLPEAMMNDPEPYFIFPVHNLQYFMGYFIISPKLGDAAQLHVKSWLISISSVLENWRIKQQLADTVAKLEYLHQTDMLTGLYNRRGYYRFFEQYYRECREKNVHLAVIMIDMNHMKDVNDRYGHAEGDYCLRCIAQSMKQCAKENEICVRTGGDEFVMLAPDYTREKADAYIRGVKSAVAGQCARDGKSYTVTVSAGCFARVPAQHDPGSIQHEAEEFLRLADDAMYAEKKLQ